MSLHRQLTRVQIVNRTRPQHKGLSEKSARQDKH